MNLVIGGKEYQLEFGLRFIRELDIVYPQTMNGVTFGLGVDSVISYLNMENPVAIYEVIKAGTAHLKSKPSNDDIEKFIVDYAEKGNLDKLFKDVMGALENSPFLKQKIKKVKEETNQK